MACEMLDLIYWNEFKHWDGFELEPIEFSKALGFKLEPIKFFSQDLAALFKAMHCIHIIFWYRERVKTIIEPRNMMKQLEFPSCS